MRQYGRRLLLVAVQTSKKKSHNSTEAGSSAEITAIVKQWADERAREEELEKCDCAVKKVGSAKNTPVVEVAARRWRESANTSGVAGPDG